MSYCLNLSCIKPLNPNGINFCQSCGTRLLPRLRNRYHIIQPLGGGGFGRTFLAEDEDKLKEHCVVKQLAPQVQGSTALHKATELFQEEARRLQQLGEHPQIPTLYAYFEQDNYLYLVQQLIEGQTLGQELQQQGIFSEDKIWEVLSELLPVLKFVHEHQVIHRDIKPENIIRRQSDRKLVLIDFGVAKQLTTNSLHHTGTSIGSYGYAPIEQMKLRRAYPASDLFSLGVTCFHLLTRINPSELWTEEGYGWVTSWQQYVKLPISASIKDVLGKLLQKNIEERYQSADEVLLDLNSRLQPLSMGHYRRPPSALLATVAPPSALIATVAPPKIQWKSNLLVGAAVVLLGLGGYISLRSLASIPTLTGHLGEVNSLAMNSNSLSHNLASSSDDKTVKIWNIESGDEIRTLTGHSDWVYAVAISPDGKTVVSGSKDKTIKVWNLNTGKEINTIMGHLGDVNDVVISQDGQMLASASDDKTIKVWKLDTGMEIRTITGHLADVNAIAFSPNGEYIASGSDDKTVKVWQLNTGEAIHTFNGHSAEVYAIAFSADGKTLVSGGKDKTIKIWQLP
ncbi:MULTISPECIES: serine/threonine-protein kinase [unclassified Nostoc]|uniref:serine/threonine-protein kinase n=1 Tax=unclassified Nostoc TaxID=2593658 RepID=UPI002AD52BD3|nr:serine/threonine-protein kinase [Nostoc sp. DedQUE03]MDZ7977122.1 serine/threonine-protein kinase [Nostoc sp. DedQUE03]MDZ8049768.1 serine/threonine-protein kinase [Nostoc sp. DedQUE02]